MVFHWLSLCQERRVFFFLMCCYSCRALELPWWCQPLFNWDIHIIFYKLKPRSPPHLGEAGRIVQILHPSWLQGSLREVICISATEHRNIHSKVKRPHCQLSSVLFFFFFATKWLSWTIRQETQFSKVFGFGIGEKGIISLWQHLGDYQKWLSQLFPHCCCPLSQSPAWIPSINVITLTLLKWQTYK